MPSAEDDTVDHENAAKAVASPAAQPGAATRRMQRIRIVTAAIVLGGVTGLAAVILFYARQSGPALPALTVERFEAARATWRANRLPDYDIRIEVKGMQPAVYEVEVRNGAARKALRNGRPLTQRRTWGTWSVDGMFATIAADVANLRHGREGRDAEVGSMQLTLGAEFHEQRHYPTRYFRLEQVQFGNNRSVTWEVTKFEIVDPTAEAPETASDKSTGGSTNNSTGGAAP